MSKKWTRSSTLHLDLPPGGARRATLEQVLRDAITSGRLVAGTGLPSSRLLAADLEISRGTVVEAYAQLTAEGYLVTAPRSGTRVADTVRSRPPSPRDPHSAAGVSHSERYAETMRDRARAPYNFEPMTSDLSGFPRGAFLAAMRQVIMTAPLTDFSYGDPRGHTDLRQALADYLGRVRGVRTDADRIMVCAGYRHALWLLSSAIRARGATTVAIENPGLESNALTIEHFGLRPVPIPVDEGGMRVGELAAAEPDAVLVTPAHQLPYGAVLHPTWRAELIRLAEQRDMLIIEDDYDGEFRYDRQPVGALQGLAPERVAYVGTTSKTLSPSMRLGWIALPDHLMEPLIDARLMTDLHTPTLHQLAFARMIVTGALDRHLRTMRLRYRARRDALMAALAERVPTVRVLGVAAGYHVTLVLPDGTDEDTVVEAMAAAGVMVHGLSRYTTAGLTLPPALVISYGSPPQHSFAPALEALVAALARLLA